MLLGSAQPNLQGNNHENDRLELFREQLSDGQVNNEREQEMREKGESLGSSEREKESITYE